MNLFAVNLLQYISLNLLRLSTTNKHPQNRKGFIAGHLTWTFIISFLYQPFLYGIGYYDAANAVWGIIASHIIILFPLFRRGMWKPLGHCFCATAFLAFLWVTCTSGGITSPQIAWFLSIKVGAYWFMGKKEGHIWSGITIFALLAVFLYGINIKQFPITFPIKHYPLFSGIIHVGVLIYYFVVLLVYEFWQEKAIQSLKKNAESRRHMYQIIAHDIKNPLTVIIGYNQLLQNKLLKDTSKSVDKALNAIQHHCDKITGMIDISLDAHELDNLSKQDLEEIDLVSIIKTNIKQNQEHANSKNIKISFVGPSAFSMTTSSFAIAQILSNLISNAIKYSPKNTNIWVRILSDQNRGFTIEVEDQGLGMTKSQIDKFCLGQRQHIGNEPTAGESSSRIGSQFLIMFVRALGAQLSIESEGQGKGTKFIVNFPSS